MLNVRLLLKKCFEFSSHTSVAYPNRCCVFAPSRCGLSADQRGDQSREEESEGAAHEAARAIVVNALERGINAYYQIVVTKGIKGRDLGPILSNKF